jgi:hypothetical protein
VSGKFNIIINIKNIIICIRNIIIIIIIKIIIKNIFKKLLLLKNSHRFDMNGKIKNYYYYNYYLYNYQ